MMTAGASPTTRLDVPTTPLCVPTTRLDVPTTHHEAGIIRFDTKITLCYHTDWRSKSVDPEIGSNFVMPKDETIHLIHGKLGHAPAKGTCVQCPIRRDSKRGELGGWTPEMYIRGMMGPADFACHMSKGFDVNDRDAQRSCTGVGNFRCNTALVVYMPDGNGRDNALLAGENREDVFATLPEFWRHHKVKP